MLAVLRSTVSELRRTADDLAALVSVLEGMAVSEAGAEIERSAQLEARQLLEAVECLNRLPA